MLSIFLKKRYLIIFICLNMSCQVYKNSSIDYLNNGEYVGTKGLYEVYLKVEENYGYVDVIYHEKRPMFNLSDTIIMDANSSDNWQGETFILFKRKNCFYIGKRNVDENNDNFPIKIVQNSEKYRDLNKRKNEIFFHDGLSELKDLYDIDYQTLNKKIDEHKMFQKIETLKHNEFKIEFEKFKSDLK